MTGARRGSGIDRAAFGIPESAEREANRLKEVPAARVSPPVIKPEGDVRMLKRILNGAIAASILLTGAAVPALADGSSPNSSAAQEDKMKQDKMTSDKMAGHMMSRKRRKHHRRHRMHKRVKKMDTMQRNKKM